MTGHERNFTHQAVVEYSFRHSHPPLAFLQGPAYERRSEMEHEQTVRQSHTRLERAGQNPVIRQNSGVSPT